MTQALLKRGFLMRRITGTNIILKITTKPGQQVWWTSDYHVFHKNLCRGTSQWTDTSGCRDFDTLEEMERIIVSNYNRLVKPDDIVFNLGDIIFGDKTYLLEFLQKLNCRNIYYVFGNHDDWMLDKAVAHSMFKQCFKSGQVEVSINKKLFVLNHYPLMVWRDNNKGSIMLHGHCHHSLADCPHTRRLDVGVDVDSHNHQKYCPWSLDEVLSVMYNKKEFRAVDHHGRREE